MKFNKKLVVTSLSTVLGLGIVGSITGTIAWYQYSTRGTASLIGVSAGESGVLQISADPTDPNSWKRDVASSDFFTTVLDANSDQKKGVQMTQVGDTADYEIVFDKAYTYVVFNDGENNTTKKTAELAFEDGKDYYNGTEWAQFSGDPAALTYYFHKPDGWTNVYAYAWNVPDNYRPDSYLRPCTWGPVAQNAALPAKAYGNPVLGVKNMTGWKEASKSVDFFQYTVEIKAIDKSGASDAKVAREVWLTDIVLVDAGATETITGALRMHLSITDHHGNDKNILIAHDKVISLDCYGKLDLDGDGHNDTVGGYDWQEGRNTEVTYGAYDGESVITTPQTAYGINEVKATNYNPETKRYGLGIPLGFTTDQAVAENLTVTVTVWLEGWAQLGATPSAIWGSNTLNKTVHAGLTFDIGDKAFNN